MVNHRTPGVEEARSALPRLQAALDYAQMGLRVLPLHSVGIGGKCTCGNATCGSAGKHPLTAHGVKEASHDCEVVRQWWKRWPFANVGIATGDGIVVIDIDPRHGGSLEALAGLVDVSDCVMVETGSGGWHLYFIYDTSILLRNTTGLLGEGIDTRANGGYVVAPPSLHSSGRNYRWLTELDFCAISDAALERLMQGEKRSTPAPDVRAQEVAAPAKVVASGSGYSIPEGKRHNELLRWTGHLRRVESNEDVLISMLQAVNKGCCRPPMTEEEVRQIVQSTRKWVAETHNEDMLEEVEWARDIATQTLAEPLWAIPSYLPEGLMLLAGKPKMGKSWLALQIALAVTSGSEVLGFPAACVGKALYLDLEQSKVHFQKRIRKILGHDNFPQALGWIGRWKPLLAGGLDDLERWMQLHPDTRLIVIDTLARVLSATNAGGSLYLSEYTVIGHLKELAQQYHAAILVVHHLRKSSSDNDPFDEISGTTGITGAADGSTILQRVRDSDEATFRMVNRFVEGMTFSISMDKERCTWSRAGEPSIKTLTTGRQDILDLFARTGVKELTPAHAAKILEKEPNTVIQLLRRMVKDGQLHTAGPGKYIQVPQDCQLPLLENQEE